MRHGRGLAAILVVATMAAWMPVPARAQDTDGFTIGEYLGLRADIVRADARVGELEAGSAEHVAATVDLAERVDDALEYLNRWMSAGAMPYELRAEAETQRYVYFENLVQLHATLGDCLASRAALEAMRAIDPGALGFGYPDLLPSAEQVVAGCVQRPWSVVAAPEAEPAAADERVSAVPVALWASGSTLILSGLVVVAAYADERQDLQDLRDANVALPPSQYYRRQELETRVTRSRRVATALTAIGGGLVATGVVAWAYGDERGTHVTAAVAPGSAMVELGATW